MAEDIKESILKVSIGMPVYNGAKFVRQALDSLLAQTFTDFELIISDNASIDDTEKICREYADKDSRIRYVRQMQNKGISFNIPFVLGQAVGEYFMWAAHDDFWASSYIEECLRGFEEQKAVILVSSMWDNLDEKSGEVTPSGPAVSTVRMSAAERFSVVEKRLYSNGGGMFYGIYKRQVLVQAMPFVNVPAADHIFVVDFALRGEFYGVPKRLFTKRFVPRMRTPNRYAISLRIRDFFVEHHPYFICEICFQRVILNSQALLFHEKIRLSIVSFYRYAFFLSKSIYWLLRDAWRGFLSKATREE